jgi:Phosphotransferase enzyme family
MNGRSYVRVRYPWEATFDARAIGPSAYYSELINQALLYGMPARRYGYVGARVAEKGVPAGLLARLWRLLPRGPDPDIDGLLGAVVEHWEVLSSKSTRLPSKCDNLSALALSRSSGRTIFVFDHDGTPLVVCKIPRGDASAIDNEARSLEKAGDTSIGPAYLGRVDEARVQEALPGAPLLPTRIHPEDVATLKWPHELKEMADAMVRLSDRTAHRAVPQELSGHVQTALNSGSMSPSLRRSLTACIDDLRKDATAVLRHADTSAHNCLTKDGRFVGLVDWEWSRFDGAPGFDTINSAIAYLDHGIGRLKWSEERALAAFRKAWAAPYFLEARTEGRRAAAAAGMGDELFEKIERVLFLRRLGARMTEPKSFATGPKAALAMLEFVCSE